MTQKDETKHGERIIVHVDEEIEDLKPGFLENRPKDEHSRDSKTNPGTFLLY